MNNLREDRLAGALLGTAVGDALGLPCEGLSARRAGRMFGGPPLRHRFILGRGMTSDDTEHACMTAQALLVGGGDVARFARSLAWRLRGWLLGLPAGIGYATLRAILKLWLGFGPNRSGVYSAGNGPAMRAAVLGAAVDDPAVLRQLVQASSRLTHTDPRAEEGAMVLAEAARYAACRATQEINAADFFKTLDGWVQGEKLSSRLKVLAGLLSSHAPVGELVDRLGFESGVSGYINHTVPAAIYCWLRTPGDFRAAVELAILLGGDTDTVGAIVGGLVGASAGASAIPSEWLAGLAEWPRSERWMRKLAAKLSAREMDGRKGRAVPLFWPGLILRNLVFLIVVLLHGLRRVLPPY